MERALLIVYTLANKWACNEKGTVNSIHLIRLNHKYEIPMFYSLYAFLESRKNVSLLYLSLIVKEHLYG